MTTRGKIVSVTKGLPKIAFITEHDVCNSAYACWYAYEVPYANIGFTGTGTKTGTWTYRGDFETGDYTASLCWTLACSGPWGRNTYGDILGEVTGKSWTNISKE
jgi:hypothetical protein